MIEGIPDFYRPMFVMGYDVNAGQPGSSWYVDHGNCWNGNPALKVTRGVPEKTYGLWGVCYPPPSEEPVRMTFSLYARGGTDNATVLFTGLCRGFAKRLRLTTQWRRYQITGDLLPGSGVNMGGRTYLILPSEGATVWVSAPQLEKGDAPTEFRDDSAAPATVRADR